MVLVTLSASPSPTVLSGFSPTHPPLNTNDSLSWVLDFSLILLRVLSGQLNLYLWQQIPAAQFLVFISNGGYFPKAQIHISTTI